MRKATETALTYLPLMEAASRLVAELDVLVCMCILFYPTLPIQPTLSYLTLPTYPTLPTLPYLTYPVCM